MDDATIKCHAAESGQSPKKVIGASPPEKATPAA
jgi:hypothetical protein